MLHVLVLQHLFCLVESGPRLSPCGMLQLFLFLIQVMACLSASTQSNCNQLRLVFSFSILPTYFAQQIQLMTYAYFTTCFGLPCSYTAYFPTCFALLLHRVIWGLRLAQQDERS